MTSKLSRIQVVAIILFGALLSPRPAHAASTVPVSIDVDVSKSAKEKHAVAPGPGSEDRLLEITLKNPTGQALTNVEVKYWLMVRDVKSRDVTVAVNDSSTLTLAPYSEEVVTSSVAKCDYTPRVAAGKAGAAKGNKFYGYGVQVVEEGKVASQTYDPPDVKTDIEGGTK